MFERAPLPRKRFPQIVLRESPACSSTAAKLLTVSLFLFLSAIPVSAQFSSAFVFASDPKGIAVYRRNDATGVLTPVPGSPFPSKEAITSMALDFKGRYLFTANYNTHKISMFTFDPNLEVLQEVTASPFASMDTDTPMFLAIEITGKTLYVINFFGSTTSASSIESFQIDSTNLALIPSSSPAVDLPGLFIAGANHPSGKSFYALVNNPSQSNPDSASFLAFNSSNGSFTTDTGATNARALCLAMDQQGEHVVTGSGSTSGVLHTYGLNTDGTLNQLSTTVLLGQPPSSVALDTLGQYLYVTLNAGPSNPSTVHIYSPATLQELSGSPLPSSFTSTAPWLVDPSAPLIFADQVYQVSPANGSLSSILPNPTYPLAPPALFSLPPGSQPVEGPVAQLSATSLLFGSLSVGATGQTQTLTITNTGGQNLSLNALSIGGTNASDFSEQDSCHVPNVLTPNQSCSAVISFAPSTTGSRTASLTITDNAAPSTESVSLSGTGLPQAPAVTLVPGSLTFGTTVAPIAQGTSTSSNITVTNSGTAALHISNVVLGGANSGDFSVSAPGCSAAIAVNSNCAIAVTFLPLATGLRSATITLTDDAPDSPQVIQINGYGSASSQTAPAVTLAPNSLTFGSATSPIAQGTSTSSNVTISNSGNAALHISNIALAGTNSSDFGLSAPNCNAPIVANSSCTITVTFLPLSTGPRSATITLSDDAPGSSQILQINGYAAADFQIAPASSSQTTATVSAGGTAQYQLQITPAAGYSGNVSLSCAGAPLAATCQIPASVTISNGVAASFNVTVTTTGSGAMLFVPNIPSPTPNWYQFAAIVLALCAVAIFLLLDHLQFVVSPNTRRLLLGSLAGITFFSILSLAGCGGGAASSVVTPPPPPVVTPSGTSTLTITATSAPQGGKQLASQTIQLTLTVK